jgi:predicted adenylyl cyclase CyaB
MPANIEVKAIALNFEHQCRLAENLSDTPCEVLVQEDVFFNATNGRLKLRIFSELQGELISYQRADTSAPTRSNYTISKTTEPMRLKLVLSSALGAIGSVKKTRRLYRVGQTRIHLDEVDGLGKFIELEVVMTPEQTDGDAALVAKALMEKLEIREQYLVSGAYLDMLRAPK